MTTQPSGSVFLVLASRRAFEALVGPIPAALNTIFRFIKPRESTRIHAQLAQCRIVISKSYTRPILNRWIFEARRLGIPTLLLIDGPLEWANLYENPSLARLGGTDPKAHFEPVIHDAVACIGEAQTRWIEQKNAGRGLQFMSYANQRIGTEVPVRRGAGDHPEMPPFEFDFLVTTAKTPYFSAGEKARLITSLSACIAALHRSGFKILVRLFDSDLCRATRANVPNATFDTTGDFTSALARAECVIGTPSSVLLEAMHQNRPTGTLLFRDSPLLYQTGWLIGCNQAWHETFESMLGHDSKRMDFQRQSLRENLSERDFFEYCDQIARGENLAAPRPIDAIDLEFENRMLRQLSGWPARWLSRFLRARQDKLTRNK